MAERVVDGLEAVEVDEVDRERRVLNLRFMRDMTQTEIANEIREADVASGKDPSATPVTSGKG